MTWPGEDNLGAIANRLGLSLVKQRLDGGVRLPGAQRAPSGGDRLAPCGPGAFRMAGGYTALANALAATLPPGAVRLGDEVASIEQVSDGGVRVTVKAKGGGGSTSGSGGGGGGGVDGGVTDVLASFAIVAVPPRVAAAHLAFSPPLPTDQLARMAATATWAGDWCKARPCFRSIFGSS